MVGYFFGLYPFWKLVVCDGPALQFPLSVGDCHHFSRVLKMPRQRLHCRHGAPEKRSGSEQLKSPEKKSGHGVQVGPIGPTRSTVESIGGIFAGTEPQADLGPES